MKKIALTTVCLLLFGLRQTWAQSDIAIFADNAYSIEIMDGDNTPDLADFTDFGTQNFGGADSTHTFTIASWGADDINVYSVDVTPGSHFSVELHPGPPFGFFLPWTFNVTFETSTAPIGTYDATVTIESDDPDENPFTFVVSAVVSGAPPPVFPEINLQGNGMDIADGDNLPSTADGTNFGSIILGNAPVMYTFIIQNTGDDLLNVPDINLTGVGASAYTLSALDPVSPIAPFEYATFTITFDPASAATFNATVQILNDDPDENPYSFAITGAATTPPPPPANDLEVRGNDVLIVNGDTSPSTADGTNFGTNPASMMFPMNHAFVIKNIGADNININSIAVTGSGAATYSFPSNPTLPYEIEPGDSTSFWISFQPSSNGTFNATCEIANDDPNESHYTFDLTGTSTNIPSQEMYVTGGGIEIINNDGSPTTLDGTDFGSVNLGGGASNLFYAYNLGQTTLNIASITITGPNADDFTASDLFVDPFLPPGEVPSGAGGFFSIDFNPAALGLRHAIVTISSDDPDENPYIFNVQGTGTAALPTWYEDSDGDTYGNPIISQMAASQPSGFVAGSTDCDDNNAAINPVAAEVCNGVDDDCDANIDEGIGSTWHADNDNDTFGNPLVTQVNCTQPIGYVANELDCDDNDSGVNPAAVEACNGVDDDCDGEIDESGAAATWYADNDNDMYGDPLVSLVNCNQPMGYVADTTDCDDSNAAINPAAIEVCNGVDDNCNGNIDEGLGSTWFADNDNDTYGNPLVSQVNCTQPIGYVSNNDDCDDSNATINPAATEVCNGFDDDCDGLVDAADPNLVDNLPPTVSCQNITIQLDSNGSVSINTTQVNAGASDNCGMPSLSVDPSNFDCFDIGANTITLTATDFVGNTATCTATVTVQDNLPPFIFCQNITVQLDANGTAQILLNQIITSLSDNCVGMSAVLSVSNFNCLNIGANSILATAIDNSNNTATCSATVTVVDDLLPTVSCQNITVTLNAFGNATITPAQISAGASDNCGTPTLSLNNSNFSCADIGDNTVVLTATVINHSASCSAIVTIVDNTLPTAICQDLTVSIGASGTVSIAPAQVDNGSTDNCGTPLVSLNISSFSCSDIGPNAVMLTATDGSGSTATCSATITVADITPPTALCKNAILNLGANGQASLAVSDIDNGSFDNCVSPVNLSLSQSSFDCSDIGTNLVTLTVIAGSPTSTCTATVTVQDNTPPTVSCQNITVPLNAAGMATITPAQVSAGTSDNCGTPSLSLDISSFNCANVGDNAVILTATAGNLTATCSTTVTIQDNTPPTAACQNITVPLNPTGTAAITPAQVNNGSSDNCGLGTLSLSQSSFSCVNTGATVSVTMTVPDLNGNTATCTASVTVVDNLPPIAICQDINIDLDPDGIATIAPSDVNNGSFDNCGAPVLSLSQSSFDCSNLGMHNLILTATDASGNSSTCTATVTINSILSINAGNDVSICNGSSAQLNAIASGANSITYTWSPATDLSDANIANPVASPGTTTTYTVTAATNGCSASDQVTVTVAPAPTAVISAASAVCQGSNISLSETSGSLGFTWAWSGPNNFSSILQNPTIPNASVLNAGQYSVTVSNASGCSTTASATVDVNNLPIADAGVDIGICAGTTAQLQATGGTGYVWSPAASLNNAVIANPIASPTATTNYTVTVTDGNNCSATDAVVVTVTPQATISGVLADCDANMTTYTVELTSNSNQLTASTGIVANNGGGSWTVSNVPVGTNLTLTATTIGGCSAMQQVTSPNCSCPAVAAPVASGNTAIELCQGLANPSFSVTVGVGETADWYDAPNGGSLLSSSSLDFIPAQSAVGTYSFYAETRVVVNGCLSLVRTHFTLTVLQNPVANAGNDVNICAGASMQLDGSGSSANGSLSYSWSPAASLNDPTLVNPTTTPSTGTTYTLTATDPKGCTDDATVNINISTVNPPLAGANQTICAGTTILVLSVSLNAGETADWYSAATGGVLLAQGTASYTPTAAGTFYVETRLFAGGCTSSNRTPISLSINPLPLATATAGGPVCAGGNVQLDASSSSGMPPLSFVWSSGATIANPTVSPANTTNYTVTVTDGNGCSATAQVTAIVNDNPTFMLGSPACDLNLINYSFSVTLGGGDQLSSTAGVVTGAGTSYTVTALSGQNLQLTATNSFTGCSTQQDVAGLVCGCPTTLAPVSGGDKIICQGTPTPALTVSVGANETAGWYTQSSGGIAVATGTSSFTPNQTAPGIYIFYAETRFTLNNSCVSSTRTPIQLTINALPTANAGSDATICESETITLNGSATGTGSLDYTWSPPALLNNSASPNPDFAAATVGTQNFTLTVTDGNGCSAMDDMVVEVADKPILAINSPVCNGLSYTLTFTTDADQAAASSGTLTGGAGSFTITDIPSLIDVTITVTNSTTGCSQQQMVTGISCNCLGLVAIPMSGGNQAVCAGATIPILAVTVGIGETANWYDSPTGGALLSANTTSFTPPAAGTYYAEAVNTTLGCVSDLRTPIVLTINPLPTASITPIGATTFCQGGSVDLTASGGTGFLWSSTQTTATISVSTTDVYTVTVSGVGGCTTTASASVTVNPTPAAAITGDNNLCLGENSVLTASGGSGYAWNTGSLVSIATVSPTADATYTVTVTGTGGCTATATVNITVHQLPTANAGADVVFCSNTNGAQLDANGSNGVGDLSFEWSPSGSLSASNIPDPIASPMADATYMLTVTDANGCTHTDAVSVSLQDAPVSIVSTNSPICMDEDLELNETAGDAMEWHWRAPNGLTSTAQHSILPYPDVVAGIYSLEITDASGCRDTTEFDVSLSGGTAFAAKFLTTNVACEGDTIHFIEISQTTDLPDAFLWNFGDGVVSSDRDPAHVYTNAGTYLVSVVVTEAGCDNFSIEKEININDCRLNGGGNGILSYKLYPTVTAGRLRLELETQDRGLLNLSIFDAFDKLVESRTRRDALYFEEAFNISEPGMYFMQIRTLQGQLILKFIVVRA